MTEYDSVMTRFPSEDHLHSCEQCGRLNPAWFSYCWKCGKSLPSTLDDDFEDEDSLVFLLPPGEEPKGEVQRKIKDMNVKLIIIKRG